ncbi:MAG: T9SS C-terminal target domain-containing protein [Calditrichaeota bacterium]|nr:MAG: T9SS C-terminal target domain-containing protein [Calditrichota bacterium]
MWRMILRKLTIYLLALFFITSIISASEVIHKQYIENLSSYIQIEPIVSSNGSYQGFIGTNSIDEVVDVYDSLGNIYLSIPLENNVLMSDVRLSNNSDTLVLYVLQDAGWNWDFQNFNIFRITQIIIYNDSVNTYTITPTCNAAYYANGLDDTKGSIYLKRDANYTPTSLVFKAKINTTLHEVTMGITYEEHHTYNEYSIDLLDEIVQSGSINLATCKFDSLDSCGVARNSYYYISVQDDPWNSYTSSSSWFGIYNCDSLLAGKSGGYISLLLSGDFVPQSENDEVIFGGRTEDLLGLREGFNSYWACYRVDNNVVSEVWWRSPPWKYEPYFYSEEKNLIYGIANGLTIHQLDCASGEYTDSVTLDHIMYHKSFLLPFTGSYPFLFGKLEDTIFIYSYNTPTDNQDVELLLPDNYLLHQNYPNPFNPSTEISFMLPQKSFVEIQIYNLLGQRVISLGNKVFPAGSHSVAWNGKSQTGKAVASGIYIYRMKTDDFTDSKKMLLLK